MSKVDRTSGRNCALQLGKHVLPRMWVLPKFKGLEWTRHVHSWLRVARESHRRSLLWPDVGVEGIAT